MCDVLFLLVYPYLFKLDLNYRPPASQIQQHSELDSDLQNDFMRKIRQSVANQIEHIDTGKK